MRPWSTRARIYFLIGWSLAVFLGTVANALNIRQRQNLSICHRGTAAGTWVGKGCIHVTQRLVLRHLRAAYPARSGSGGRVRALARKPS